jgi:hypothetical protein
VKVIANQILGGTREDSQGERLSKAFLQRYCDYVGDGRIPLHQQHDMSKAVAGYIENVRLVPDPEIPSEWCVLGDVYLESGRIEDALGGFSISGMEMIRASETATALVYIPYPHYNDAELISVLSDDPNLSVGKWIKKDAEPVSWVLLCSVIAFAITPIWDDIYKRKIAPRIDNLLEKYQDTFNIKGLRPELVQLVIFHDAEVEVRIIPDKENNNECLKSDSVKQGLREVVSFLENDQKAGTVGVRRIVIFYNSGMSKYSLHRVEYSDGDVVHHA